jgi:hypothetical protein
LVICQSLTLASDSNLVTSRLDPFAVRQTPTVHFHVSGIPET